MLRPQIARPRKSKSKIDSYSVNYTTEGYPIKFYRSGKIILEVSFRCCEEIEISKATADELIYKKPAKRRGKNANT